MPLIPWFLKALGGWQSIKAQVNDRAIAVGRPTYDEQPTLYRFAGWGSVGFPPRLACNVYYLSSTHPVDLGRFVAK